MYFVLVFYKYPHTTYLIKKIMTMAEMMTPRRVMVMTTMTEIMTECFLSSVLRISWMPAMHCAMLPLVSSTWRSKENFIMDNVLQILRYCTLQYEIRPTWAVRAWVQQSPVQYSWCSRLLPSTKLSLLQVPEWGLSSTSYSVGGTFYTEPQAFLLC